MLARDQGVIIIGGGIVGLSLARELVLRGRYVTVLERDSVGSGSTSAALGVLSEPAPNKLSAYSRLCRAGFERHPVLARELLKEVGVDVGFRACGSIRLAESKRGAADRLLTTWRSAGVEPRWIELDEIRSLVPGYDGRRRFALAIDREAVVNTRKLMRALRLSCEHRGVEIREDVGEFKLTLSGARARIEFVHDAKDLELDAAIVVAAGAWSAKLMAGIDGSRLQIAPIRGQAMWLDRPAPACVVHTDIAAPSYYLVPQRFGQAWFGSTVEDAGFHDWTTDAGYAELIDAAREIDPRISDASVIDIWSGLRPRALRLGGPYLGAWPGIENLWLACGHFKSGVLTGPPSASLLAEAMVDGRPIDADFSLEAAQRE